MPLIVNAKSKTLLCAGKSYPCRIGRDGYIDGALGREGDWKTPLGRYEFRYGFYRADRVSQPNSTLTFRAINRDDGWCDDSDDPAYNLPVRLPYPSSVEHLWKQSGVYDILIVLSHNDGPPSAGLGSAIFLHVSAIDDKATAGCVAVSPNVMATILPHFAPGETIEIIAS